MKCLRDIFSSGLSAQRRPPVTPGNLWIVNIFERGALQILGALVTRSLESTGFKCYPMESNSTILRTGCSQISEIDLNL